MSIAIAGTRFASRRVAAMTARQSEPTNPAMGGGKYTCASGFIASPRSAARTDTERSRAGANGAPVKPIGERPSAR